MVGTLGMGMITPCTQDTVTAEATTAIIAIIAATAKAAGWGTRIHTSTALNFSDQGCPMGTLILAAAAVMARGTGAALTEVDMTVAATAAAPMGSSQIITADTAARCPDTALTDTL